MKKKIALIAALVILMASCILPVGAASIDQKVDSGITVTDTDGKATTFYEDGSYVVTTVEKLPNLARGTMLTGQKLSSYYNGSNELQWNIYLYGTFNVTYGSSAPCVGVDYRVDIINTNWHTDSVDAFASYNQAVCHYVMKSKFLGITVKTVNDYMYLNCDINGNLF